MDPNNTGIIKYEHFCECMSTRPSSSQSKDELRKAFQVFDKNNMGFITAPELRTILQSLGEKMSDAEFLEMTKGHNFARSGRIYYEGINTNLN